MNSDGRTGGYAGGEKAKIEMLRGEGVEIKDGIIIDFRDKLFIFD